MGFLDVLVDILARLVVSGGLVIGEIPRLVPAGDHQHRVVAAALVELVEPVSGTVSFRANSFCPTTGAHTSGSMNLNNSTCLNI